MGNKPKEFDRLFLAGRCVRAGHETKLGLAASALTTELRLLAPTHNDQKRVLP